MLQTKRFLFNILKDNYNLECYAILGARRVGKTILLQQIANEYEDTLYLDLSTIEDSFNIYEYIENNKNRGIKRFCFDEVCKLIGVANANFIKAVKEYCSELTFFISGSVSVVVERMCDAIGRGYSYELPPIMYIERLCWENDCKEVNQDSINLLSTYNNFIAYIECQNMGGRKEHLGYINSVVRDTTESYINRTSMELFSLDLSKDTLDRALKYISLCQFVYRNATNAFVNIEQISEEIYQNNKEMLEGYRQNWNLKNSEIESTIALLYGCHLAKAVNIYTGNSINAVYNKFQEDINVKACVFEYPWLSSYYIEGLQNESSYIDLWVENAISIRAAYLYRYADKYRSASQEEIDLIYSVGETTKFFGLEVKNRPHSSINRKYIMKEKNIANSIGLSGLNFTCSDDCKTMLRIDKVIASLELAYVDLCSKDIIYCPDSIYDLVIKYF